jgi:hypothetical protein
VEASEPASDGQARGSTREVPVRDSAGVEPRRFDGVLEVGDDAWRVSAETSRRLTCDASLVTMRHDADGGVLDVGRKTRTIPPAIRRALQSRDTRCRFPGCTARRCDAHHVEHWADGGATRLENLVLLCRRHHRAMREGGFGVMRGRDGELTFLRPDGVPVQAAPVAPYEPPGLDAMTPRVTGTPLTWDGTRFDLPWTIDVLYRRQSDPKAEPEDEDRCESCGNRSRISMELVGGLPA